jgi:UPF0755 protein
MNKKKLILYFLAFAAVMLLAVLYIFYGSNTGSFKDKKYIYVHTGSQFSDLVKTLEDSAIVKNIGSFKRMAGWFDLDENIHPGRYEIVAGMGNYKMVSMLKAGRQTAVKLVINKLRTKEDIIRKLSSQLEPDAAAWNKLFTDSAFLHKNNIDSNQIQTLIMPNTYEFYWNVNTEKVMEKLIAYTTKWWTAERKAKAAQQKLSPKQVITIASIVEEETLKNDEKPVIASVYINRYRKGMNLGADPTVKFAVGDFKLRRILKIHTDAVSPYNTYRVQGLPPGPICTPSESSIDAVLNAANTNYLFFCAKADRSGYHNFAATYAEHLANADNYHKDLNARGIK